MGFPGKNFMDFLQLSFQFGITRKDFLEIPGISSWEEWSGRFGVASPGGVQGIPGHPSGLWAGWKGFGPSKIGLDDLGGLFQPQKSWDFLDKSHFPQKSFSHPSRWDGAGNRGCLQGFLVISKIFPHPSGIWGTGPTELQHGI